MRPSSLWNNGKRPLDPVCFARKKKCPVLFRCAELEADIEGKDTTIETLQAAVDQVCAELKRVEHENLDLKKSLSPDVAIAECQTE